MHEKLYTIYDIIQKFRRKDVIREFSEYVLEFNCGYTFLIGREKKNTFKRLITIYLLSCLLQPSLTICSIICIMSIFSQCDVKHSVGTLIHNFNRKLTIRHNMYYLFHFISNYFFAQWSVET